MKWTRGHRFGPKEKSGPWPIYQITETLSSPPSLADTGTHRSDLLPPRFDLAGDRFLCSNSLLLFITP
jgi:hypothetical protein